MRRSPHQVAKFKKFICRYFNWVPSYVLPREFQQHFTLSGLYPWNSTYWGNSRENVYSKDRGKGEKPLIAQVLLISQPVVCHLYHFLQLYLNQCWTFLPTPWWTVVLASSYYLLFSQGFTRFIWMAEPGSQMRLKGRLQKSLWDFCLGVGYIQGQKLSKHGRDMQKVYGSQKA